MKNSIKLTLSVLLCFVMIFCITGCGNNNKTDANSTTAASGAAQTEDAGLWAGATYTEDTELGTGSKTLEVEIKAEDKSITFTVKTDKETLGDALMEHELLEGEESEYGLFIKKVNGIRADYDLDNSYWALSKDGEYLNTGADTTEISDGEHYEFTYTEG